MTRIQGQLGEQTELAMQTLSWLACARRPLTSLELQHALAIEKGESSIDEENMPEVEDILAVCAGLVTIENESGIIRLVHYTTQEYLERKKDLLFPSVEDDISRLCVTYISFDTVSYTHLRAHETDSYLVCRLLLEKKKYAVFCLKKKNSFFFFFFLMIRRQPRSTHCISSAASDVYKRQAQHCAGRQDLIYLG